MKLPPDGSLTFVSGLLSQKAAPGAALVSAINAAVEGLTGGLALDFAPARVNTICPGPFLTDIAKAWPEQMRQSADNALGRPGYPEEIVTAALYLASPASSFTTGSLLRVDGSAA